MATQKKTSLASPDRVSEYPAILNVQRSSAPDLKFYLFHAPASEIYQWGLIDRREPERPKSIQRSLNKAKVRKINEYLSAFDVNTIATSIVIVFDRNCVSYTETNGKGKLKVTWSAKKPAGIIVDGQHRVMGANQFENGNIHLNVVGIIGADSTEGAFQFLVINNNSSKVSPSHVKALFTDYKEEELLKRMLDSGSTNLDEEKITALDYFDGGVDSPFKGQIKWAKNKNGFIVPNALESGFGEIQTRTALLAVQGFEVETFTEIWKTIKKDWGHLWNIASHLLEKACIQALTTFISDSLVQMRLFNDDEIDYLDPDILAKKTSQVLKRLDPGFFEVEWTLTGLDTRAGQEMLVGDIKQMASNTKALVPWHNSLQTISIGAVSGDTIKKGSKPKKKK